jgi:hypothetical protein
MSTRARGTGLPKRGLPAALKALRQLEKNDVRLTEEATQEQKDLVFAARATIVEVMLRPSRWSQMRLHAAASIIDEVCGKLTDKVDVKGQQTVEVVINQNVTKGPQL